MVSQFLSTLKLVAHGDIAQQGIRAYPRLFASFVAFILVTSASTPPTLAQRSPAQISEIKVGIPGNSIGFASWFLAQASGIFAKNGINVTFVYLSADLSPSALITGGIQATPTIGTVSRAFFAGYKVKDVAVTGIKPMYELLAKDSINSISDLTGKTVIASQPKETPALLLNYLLAKARLVPNKDVQILPVGSEAGRQTLMLSGRADAIMDDVKNGLLLQEKMPHLHVLVDTTQMPEQLVAGVGVAASLVDSNPDLVRRMILSVAQANVFARSDPAEAARYLSVVYKVSPADGKLLDEAVIRSLPNRMVPTANLYEKEAQFDSLALGIQIDANHVRQSWDTRLAAEVDAEMARSSESGGMKH